MKHSRNYILKQIGIGIKQAEFDRLQKSAPKLIPDRVQINTLQSTIIVHPEHIDYAKYRISYQIGEELRKSLYIRWNESPAQYGTVEVTGTVKVVSDKPPKEGDGENGKA